MMTVRIMETINSAQEQPKEQEHSLKGQQQQEQQHDKNDEEDESEHRPHRLLIATTARGEQQAPLHSKQSSLSMTMTTTTKRREDPLVLEDHSTSSSEGHSCSSSSSSSLYRRRRRAHQNGNGNNNDENNTHRYRPCPPGAIATALGTTHDDDEKDHQQSDHELDHSSSSLLLLSSASSSWQANPQQPPQQQQPPGHCSHLNRTTTPPHTPLTCASAQQQHKQQHHSRSNSNSSISKNSSGNHSDSSNSSVHNNHNAEVKTSHPKGGGTNKQNHDSTKNSGGNSQSYTSTRRLRSLHQYRRRFQYYSSLPGTPATTTTTTTTIVNNHDQHDHQDVEDEVVEKNKKKPPVSSSSSAFSPPSQPTVPTTPLQQQQQQQQQEASAETPPRNNQVERPEQGLRQRLDAACADEDENDPAKSKSADSVVAAVDPPAAAAPFPKSTVVVVVAQDPPTTSASVDPPQTANHQPRHVSTKPPEGGGESKHSGRSIPSTLLTTTPSKPTMFIQPTTTTQAKKDDKDGDDDDDDKKKAYNRPFPLASPPPLSTTKSAIQTTLETPKQKVAPSPSPTTAVTRTPPPKPEHLTVVVKSPSIYKFYPPPNLRKHSQPAEQPQQQERQPPPYPRYDSQQKQQKQPGDQERGNARETTTSTTSKPPTVIATTPRSSHVSSQQELHQHNNHEHVHPPEMITTRTKSTAVATTTSTPKQEQQQQQQQDQQRQPPNLREQQQQYHLHPVQSNLRETARVRITATSNTSSKTPTTASRTRSGTSMDHPVDLTWYSDDGENSCSSSSSSSLRAEGDVVAVRSSGTPQNAAPINNGNNSGTHCNWQQDETNDEESTLQHLRGQQDKALSEWRRQNILNGIDNNSKTGTTSNHHSRAAPILAQQEDNCLIPQTASQPSVAAAAAAIISTNNTTLPPPPPLVSSSDSNKKNNNDNPRPLPPTSQTMQPQHQQSSTVRAKAEIVTGNTNAAAPQQQPRPVSIHKRPRPYSDAVSYNTAADPANRQLVPSTPTPNASQHQNGTLVSCHQLHHPYSRPNLLRTPQRSMEIWKSYDSPVASPMTQRSSSFFNPFSLRSKAGLLIPNGCGGGLELDGSSDGGEKTIYQQQVELRLRRRQSTGDLGQSKSVFGLGFFSNSSHQTSEPGKTGVGDSSKADNDDGDDAYSVDSETLLEIWASKIRSELRHEALLEMASEAERAAESGQESFSLTRPWAYHEDKKDEDTEIPSVPRPQFIRRNASYSEGVTPQFPLRASSIGGAFTTTSRNRLMGNGQYSRSSSTSYGLAMSLRLRRQLRPQKVPIQELRNVDEVFPSFDNLHKNLRTHFARNDISEDCLFFEEHADETNRGVEVVVTTAQGGQPGGTTAAAAERQRTDSSSSLWPSSNNHDTKTSSSTANSKQQDVSSVNTSSSFLDSFSFELLGSAAAAGVSVIQCPSNPATDENEGSTLMDNDNTDDEDDEDDPADSCSGGIGDLLSNHISTEKQNPPPRREILPGMEDAVYHLHRLMVAAGRRKPPTAEKQSSNSSSTPRRERKPRRTSSRSNYHDLFLTTTPTQQTRGQPTREEDPRPPPRALFDDLESTSRMTGNVSEWNETIDYSPGIIQTPMPPPHESTHSMFKTNEKSTSDFITPAKLRRIRVQEGRRGVGDQRVSIPMPLLNEVPGIQKTNSIVTPTRNHPDVGKSARRNNSHFPSSTAEATANTTMTAVMTPSSPTSDGTPTELLLPTLPTIVGSEDENTKSVGATSPRSSPFLRPSLSSSSRRRRLLQDTDDEFSENNRASAAQTPPRQSPLSELIVISDVNDTGFHSADSLNKQHSQHTFGFRNRSSESLAEAYIRGPVLSQNHKQHSMAESTEDGIVDIADFSSHSDDVDENGSHRQNENDTPQKDAETPAMRDCSCLNLSPSTSLDNFGITSPENPLIVIAPDEESINSTGSQEDHEAERSREPFAAAMKMFSHFSPRRAEAGVAAAAATKAERLRKEQQKRRRRRALYVGYEENDDFMKNFLYVGKKGMAPSDMAGMGMSDRRECVGEPCQDDRFCETNLVSTMANQCYAALVLDPEDPESMSTDDVLNATNKYAHPSTGNPPAAAPATASSATTKESLFGSSGTPQKLEPETWFDVATEKVDTVIESLVGSAPQNDWRQLFEPPSLRKLESFSASTQTSSTPKATTTVAQPKTPQGNSHYQYQQYRPLSYRRWTGGQLCTTLEEETNSDKFANGSSSISPGSTRSNQSVRVEEEEKKEQLIRQVLEEHTQHGTLYVDRNDVYSPPIISLLSTPQEDDLNDAQFELIYGISREEHYRHQDDCHHRELEQQQQYHHYQPPDHMRTRNRGSWAAAQDQPSHDDQTCLSDTTQYHYQNHVENDDDHDNLALYHSQSLQDHRRYPYQRSLMEDRHRPTNSIPTLQRTQVGHADRSLPYFPLLQHSHENEFEEQTGMILALTKSY